MEANVLLRGSSYYILAVLAVLWNMEENLLEFSKTTYYFQGLIPHSSMFDHQRSHRPSISYRPIRPSDLEVIEKLHAELFPIRWENPNMLFYYISSIRIMCVDLYQKRFYLFLGMSLSFFSMSFMVVILCRGELLTGIGIMVRATKLSDLLLQGLIWQEKVR